MLIAQRRKLAFCSIKKAGWGMDLAKARKYILLMCYVHFAIYMAVALINYDLRLLYYETISDFTGMLNSDNFYIVHGRYSQLLYEFLPYCAMRAGAGLNAVMMVFSASFVLMHFTCFLITLYVFKNLKLAVGICLATVFGLGIYFYYPISEYINGTILLFVLMAWREWYFKSPPVHAVISVGAGLALMTLVLYMHPIFLGVVLVQFALPPDGKSFLDRRYIKIALLFAVLIIARYTLGYISPLEKERAANTLLHIVDTLGHLRFIYTLGILHSGRWLAAIVFVLYCGWLLLHKRWIKAALLAGNILLLILGIELVDVPPQEILIVSVTMIIAVGIVLPIVSDELVGPKAILLTGLVILLASYFDIYKVTQRQKGLLNAQKCISGALQTQPGNFFVLNRRDVLIPPDYRYDLYALQLITISAMNNEPAKTALWSYDTAIYRNSEGLFLRSTILPNAIDADTLLPEDLPSFNAKYFRVDSLLVNNSPGLKQVVNPCVKQAYAYQ